MKFSKILSFCKSAKTFHLYWDEEQDCQWIGDGNAFYPLLDHPMYEKDNLFNVASIKDTQKEKFAFISGECLPHGYDGSDSVVNEFELQTYNIKLQFEFGKDVYLVLHTSIGGLTLNKKYLEPIDIASSICERRTADGEIYFVVKQGMEIAAIITPTGFYNTYSVSDTLKQMSEEFRCTTEFIQAGEYKGGYRQ